MLACASVRECPLSYEAAVDCGSRGALDPARPESGRRELRPGKGVRYASDEWALTGFFFEPFQAMRLPNPQTLDREALVAYYASMGWLADLPNDERLTLLDEVRSLLAGTEYTRPWETHAHWTLLAAGVQSALS